MLNRGRCSWWSGAAALILLAHDRISISAAALASAALAANGDHSVSHPLELQGWLAAACNQHGFDMVIPEAVG